MFISSWGERIPSSLEKMGISPSVCVSVCVRQCTEQECPGLLEIQQNNWRSDCIHGRQRKGPVLLCIAKTASSMGAMLTSKEKSDSEHSPFHENIFPVSSSTANLLCLLGWFLSLPLPTLLLIFFLVYISVFFLLQLNDTESWCCIFCYLQNSVKYCRARANQSRGVTMTSQMRFTYFPSH